MARIEWIEQRLLNWARWKLGADGGSMGYAGVDLTSPTPGVRDPYAEAAIPTNAIEAGDTDEAVERLHPGELRATVLEYYVGAGTYTDKLRRLVCSKATMYARIDQAHRQLAEHFSARRDRQQAERVRVERLQQAQRPALAVDIGPLPGGARGSLKQ